ncbi:MAG TPA: hypothetical protein VER12_13010 [Polyangiaceae bacterium]|nr:hypothetical protein [Polyangiaceae bacterium]
MKRHLLASVGFGSVILGCVTAHAEVVIAKPIDGLEVYTAGRVGAFAEVVDGDAQPPQIDGKPTPTADGIAIQSGPGPNGENNGAHATAFRMRSGFLGNILTLGVRYQLTPYTTVSGQISIWATAETDSQRTYLRNFTDEREGFLKVEGPGGTLTVGRQLSLFSRGAIQINFLYGHQFGVGAPVGFNEFGPSGGHIGYGVLAPVFAAGMVYATPAFHGLQLTAGYFDAGTLVGQYWARTKAGRAEGEATYDADFGGANRLHVFVNGAHQKLYGAQTTEKTDIYGVGAGARLEVGPFHVGVAGHTGKGLGINYFLNGSDSLFNANTYEMRNFDGAYVQTQYVLKKFDFNVGWGITRLHQLTADIDPQYFVPGNNYPSISYLKSQMGVSAVVVYHISPSFHASVDYFRSDQRWWQGEKQILSSYNAGATLTW